MGIKHLDNMVIFDAKKLANKSLKDYVIDITPVEDEMSDEVAFKLGMGEPDYRILTTEENHVKKFVEHIAKEKYPDKKFAWEEEGSYLSQNEKPPLLIGYYLYTDSPSLNNIGLLDYIIILPTNSKNNKGDD